MAAPVDQIRTRIEALLRGVQVGGVSFLKKVGPWNDQVDPLPQVQVTYSGGSQAVFDTASTLNQWPFIGELYLKHPVDKAQVQLADFWPAMLTAFRSDPTLGGTCDRVTISDRDPPMWDFEKRYAYKAFDIVAETLEEMEE